MTMLISYMNDVRRSIK